MRGRRPAGHAGLARAQRKTRRTGKMLRAMTIAVAATLAAATANAASPDQVEMNDRVQTYGSTDFVCTGISEETRHDPSHDRYSLKLVFSTVEGDYVADVQTRVTDSSGAVVLEASCFAPWLLADLPPGQYRVSASAGQGEPREVEVTVTDGAQSSQVIQFPNIKGT